MDPVVFDYPAIAVSPLDCIAADPRQRALADGIADDLIAALTKIGWLSVATRATSLPLKERALTGLQIARTIGVRYLLSGRVRPHGDRIRITLQLIDAIVDRQIWTGSYDQDTFAGFALGDEICERIVTAIEPQLFIAEHLRINGKEAANFNDWECLVRALSLMNTRAEADIANASALLNKAVSINPQSAQNHSLRSIASTLRVHMSWADRQAVIPAALTMAYKALSLNPEEPWAHAALGYALIWKDPEQAITALEGAIALNPTFAAAHYFLALASTYGGHDCDYAFAHAQEAERWAKRDLLMRGYVGAPDNVRATACFAAERYLRGSDYARRAATYVPSSPTAHRAMLINLALEGEVERAKDALRTVRRLAPKMSQTWLNQNAMWTSKGVNKRYMEAFRIAGIIPR
jgi:TolB-like protein/tetratricopeptide (TPR) repeat protein